MPVEIELPRKVGGAESRQHQDQEEVKDEDPQAEFGFDRPPPSNGQQPDQAEDGKDQEVEQGLVQALKGQLDQRKVVDPGRVLAG